MFTLTLITLNFAYCLPLTLILKVMSLSWIVASKHCNISSFTSVQEKDRIGQRFYGSKIDCYSMRRKLTAILCKMVSSETLSFMDLFSLGDFRETCHRCWRQYDTTVEYEQLCQPVRCHGSLAGHKVQGHSSKSVHIMALQLKWTVVCVFPTSYDWYDLHYVVLGLQLAWHPVKEGRLGFGTDDGRVGVFDTLSNK